MFSVGLIIWQLLQSLRKGLLSDRIPVDEIEFFELMGNKLPKPSVALTADELPCFGPFYSESSLEPLNRCSASLRTSNTGT